MRLLTPLTLVAAIVLLGAALVVALESRQSGTEPDWTSRLDVGRWTLVEPGGSAYPRFRWTHAGAAYQPRSNSLLMFGADTHLVSFDNAIAELRLDDLVWVSHPPASPRYSLRTDFAGRRVAGVLRREPWPMHIYDAMLFDPTRDQLRIFSGAKHSFLPSPGAQLDPGWSYDSVEGWTMAEPLSGGLPNFFANAAVYDAARDTIIAYTSTRDATPFLPLAGEDEVPRVGLWELGPGRDSWLLASAETHHWGWFNAEFDGRAGLMLVFGGKLNDNSVWAYRPAARVGQAGVWERREPDGDDCPGGLYFPAAYDTRRGVTLLIPPDRKAGRSVTCTYDASSNTYRRLPGADLPFLGLNYTMVYSQQLDIFVLVGGDFFSGEPTRVWALKAGAIPAAD